VKRLGRYVFNGCAALSLLLWIHAVILVVLWVRAPGDFHTGYDFFQAIGPDRMFTMADIDAQPAPPPSFAWAGFRVQRGYTYQYTLQEGRWYSIPCWFVALAAAVLPSMCLRNRVCEWRKARAARLLRERICPTCGYDLRVQLAECEQAESNGRASPQRCPECGTVASVKQVA
jgi:hypothetical protein